LGEFCLFGDYFLAIFRKLQKKPTFLAHFYHCESVALDNFDKNGLGHILGDFGRTHLVTLPLSHASFYRRVLPISFPSVNGRQRKTAKKLISFFSEYHDFCDGACSLNHRFVFSRA
jgi:hypothetical protein